MSVRITEDDFDIALEHEKLKSRDAGAIVTFNPEPSATYQTVAG